MTYMTYKYVKYNVSNLKLQQILQSQKCAEYAKEYYVWFIKLCNMYIYLYQVLISVCLSFCLSDNNSGTPG